MVWKLLFTSLDVADDDSSSIEEEEPSDARLWLRRLSSNWNLGGIFENKNVDEETDVLLGILKDLELWYFPLLNIS